MSKNPVLKGSKWRGTEEMFVADAGTMTITHTLEFVSKTEVLVKESSYLPSHPAMYMNPDGTVDRIPARSSETEYRGTYKFQNDLLTITDEQGREKSYFFTKDGTFVRDVVFSRVVE